MYCCPKCRALFVEVDSMKIEHFKCFTNRDPETNHLWESETCLRNQIKRKDKAIQFIKDNMIEDVGNTTLPFAYMPQTKYNEWKKLSK